MAKEKDNLNNVRFVRIRGRVVPIRTKTSGLRVKDVGVIKGAAAKRSINANAKRGKTERKVATGLFASGGLISGLGSVSTLEGIGKLRKGKAALGKSLIKRGGAASTIGIGAIVAGMAIGSVGDRRRVENEGAKGIGKNALGSVGNFALAFAGMTAPLRGVVKLGGIARAAKAARIPSTT